MNYSVSDCIQILRYSEKIPPSKEFYVKCEQIMEDLLIKLHNYNKLTNDEYVFLILCFDHKIEDWALLCEEENRGGNTVMDMPYDFIEFNDKFSEKGYKITSIVFQNYSERDAEKLYHTLKEISVLYRDAKNWLIKKGYEV